MPEAVRAHAAVPGGRALDTLPLSRVRQAAKQEGSRIIQQISQDTDPCQAARTELAARAQDALRMHGAATFHTARSKDDICDTMAELSYDTGAMARTMCLQGFGGEDTFGRLLK